MRNRERRGLIFVLLDGCRFDAARENMGYTEHLIEQGKGAKLLVNSQLPSSSRPLYETLLTGLPPCRHGICNNLSARRSSCENIFSLCRKEGLATAASAYHWISELYVKAPFEYEQRIQLGGEGLIQNGIYYFEDRYPDSHVFSDAQFLLGLEPDFLMIHTMNIDDAGHRFGADSDEYHRAVLAADVLLASFLPGWMERGYDVAITADHGMTQRRQHNGNTREQREVPFYVISGQVRPGDYSASPVDQLFVAPILCRLLGIEPGREMRSTEEMEADIFEQ